ncbi:nose resistant to fluoxetine protein 6-like [Arctopsyche grandis]|uniref:nose resistant to fluoxetine protein 6-like n=1 Tax=Arctopsyche grandis TaxID=121162 RepID=UPI00406D71BC
MAEFAIRALVVLLGVTMAATDDGLKSYVDQHLMRQSVFYGLAATALEEPSRTPCGKQLAKMAEEVVNRSRWAIKMMDASGMPNGGLVWGGTYWLGSQRQCKATGILKNLPVSPVLGPITVETAKDLPPFPIAYFAAYFQHSSDIQSITHMENEFRITLGLCLPKSCEGPELTSLLQKYFDSKMLLHQSIYNTTYRMEDVKKLVDDFSWLWQFKTILIGLIFVAAITACFIGTVFDLKYYQPMVKLRKSAICINNNVKESEENCTNYGVKDAKNICMQTDQMKKHEEYKPIDISLGYRILRCFSLYKSNIVIFSTKIPSDSIMVIHGIRFFSMLYTILGHTIIFMQEFFNNRAAIFYVSDEFIVQPFSSAAFAVDTFFFMSGFALAHSFFQTQYGPSKRKHNISERAYTFLSSVVKRFLRITPSYMITLGIAVIMSEWRFRKTPFWSNERNDLICPNYWWRNILYINNLFPRSEMCLPWSWYLSNDMQSFVITSFCLVLSTMYFKTAVSLLTVFLLGCIGFTVNSVYETNFIPTLDQLFVKREAFYDNPLVRIGPYIIGVYTAYIVYTLKKKLHLKKYVLWLLWIVGPLLNLYLIFAMYDKNISLDYSAAFTGLYRIVWAIGIAWIVIACETGNAGLLKDILCFKYLIPMSRLTFLAYLVNPIVIFWLVSYSDKPYQAEIPDITFSSMGFMVLTFIVAYVMTLLFESPNIALTTIFFDYMKGSKKHTVQSANMKTGIGADSTSNENAKMPDEIASKN